MTLNEYQAKGMASEVRDQFIRVPLKHNDSRFLVSSVVAARAFDTEDPENGWQISLTLTGMWVEEKITQVNIVGDEDNLPWWRWRNSNIG